MASASTQPTRITILLAGTNMNSNSAVLAKAFERGICTHPNIECSTVHLRTLRLHHFSLEDYDAPLKDDDFPELRSAIQDADGVLIATPVWNFSVPAHLKNAIDRMGAFALDDTHSRGQLGSKPFGILFTGGAPLIAWKALLYLTTLHVAEAIKYYGGTVIFRHFEPRCVPGRGKFGLVVDQRPESIRAMEQAGARFAASVIHFRTTGTFRLQHRLWQRWFEFLYRVGNRIMYPIGNRQ